MRPKLLIVVLALMLAGTNCDAASLCASRCMSSASAAGSVVHHHQMESQTDATSISHHIHTRTHGAYCTECPPEVGNNLNQSTDCQGLLQIQAIREASFSLTASRGVAHPDVPHTPAGALALADGGGPSLRCDTSPRIRTSDPGSVPLRI